MENIPVAPHQYSWEDVPHIVSLHRDDVWIGCYQHLGIVQGKHDAKIGVRYLQTALGAITRHYHPVVPGDKTIIGDLERDLAYLKLRWDHVSETEIRQHLLSAQQSAEASGSLGKQAFTYIAWAKLYDRLAQATSEREQIERRQHRQNMEQAIEQALELIEREHEDRSMRQAICLIDAAQLYQAHGIPLNKQQLSHAAQLCITYGYGGQAQEILNIQGIEAFLSVENHRELVGLVQKVYLT